MVAALTLHEEAEFIDVTSQVEDQSKEVVPADVRAFSLTCRFLTLDQILGSTSH